MDALRGWWKRLDINNVVYNLKVHRHGIDGDLVLSCVVLAGARQETVREVEAIDPEEIGNSSVQPLLEELQSLPQVTNETAQWLETRVAFL